MPASLRSCGLLFAVLIFSQVALPCVRAIERTPSDYRYKAWTREHGLPDNRVQTILQTRDGYLWVGTRAGLARFDGLKFTVFNRANHPEMTSDNCIALTEDSEGSVILISRTLAKLKRAVPGFPQSPNRPFQ